jgi:AcrR family transcriptional regulator
MNDASPALRRRPRNARADILDAAQRVVARDGAARLTIEAVAREVGLTKGGVLYNFPSKAALLKGMLERMIETFSAILAEQVARETGRPNPTLRALLAVADHLDRIDPELQMAMISAAAEDPDLLDPLRRLIDGCHAAIDAEAGDRVMAQVIIAAFDGLKFQRIMRFPPVDPETRAGVFDRLRTLAETLEGRT